MGKRKNKQPKVELNLTEEEKQYRLLFDFAYYIENLPRGNVGGAIILLREFLTQRGVYNNGSN